MFDVFMDRVLAVAQWVVGQLIPAWMWIALFVVGVILIAEFG